MTRGPAAGQSASVVRQLSGVGRRAYRTPSPRHLKNLAWNSTSQVRFTQCKLLMAGRLRSKDFSRSFGSGFFVRDEVRAGKGGYCIRHHGRIS